MILPPPKSTLFPYTTLFRSQTRSKLLKQLILLWSNKTLDNFSVSEISELARSPFRPDASTNATKSSALSALMVLTDRKSTRLNSSHTVISYAVFCLKKKKQVVARAAELAGKFVAQEQVEPREGGMRRGLHVGLERHDARQLHLQAGGMHRLVVLRDDVYALEKDRLDGVLPRPQRQWVIAQRAEVRIEDQCGPTAVGHMRVQGFPVLLATAVMQRRAY